MAGRFTPDHALQYTQGVDRSPTEVAALALADSPGIDPVQFLVEACQLDIVEAKSAVALIEGKPSKKRAAPATPVAGKAPTKKELVAALAELDVEIDPAWKVTDLAGALEWTLATIEEPTTSAD